MEPVLLYMLRSSIILSLFYGFYKLFFCKNTFHTVNRCLLIIILFISVILPFFHFDFLPNNVQEGSSYIMDLSLLESFDQLEVNQHSTVIPWILIISTILLSGALFFLCRYIIGLIQIIKIIQGSEKHLITYNINLCISDSEVAPFSWLNYIVISRRDYNTDIDGAIIRHEKVHILKNHSADLILVDLFTCLFWFNPFSWLLKREIQSVHEFQADEEVINNGVDIKLYQLLLIRKSVGEHTFALANNFRKRDLHKRITMMIKTKTNNRKKWVYTAVLPVLLLSMIVLSIPKLNAQTVEEEPAKPIKVVRTLSMDSVLVEVDTDVVKISETKIDTLTRVRKEIQTEIQLRGEGVDNLLYIVDGEKVTKEAIKKINPNDILAVNVLKSKASIEQYGEEGKDGVIIITTKSNPNISEIEINEGVKKNIEKRLIIIDGEKMPKDFDLNIKDSTDIESVTVLKDEPAVDKYGEEGNNGVIIIKRKIKKQTK